MRASRKDVVIARSHNLNPGREQHRCPEAALCDDGLRSSSQRNHGGWKGKAHDDDVVVVDAQARVHAAWFSPEPLKVAAAHPEPRGRLEWHANQPDLSRVDRGPEAGPAGRDLPHQAQRLQHPHLKRP